jgi:hypothetical protein
MPRATRDVYLLNGKAYLLLKRLARTARRLFKDDPTGVSKLVLGILNRHGHKRDGDEPATPAPAPGA